MVEQVSTFIAPCTCLDKVCAIHNFFFSVQIEYTNQLVYSRWALTLVVSRLGHFGPGGTFLTIISSVHLYLKSEKITMK